MGSRTKGFSSSMDYATHSKENMGQMNVNAYKMGQISKEEKDARLSRLGVTTDYAGNVVRTQKPRK